MATKINTHVSRMEQEHSQLKGRLEKLEAFAGTATFLSLPFDEQRLMRRQAFHMKEYLDILTERLCTAST